LSIAMQLLLLRLNLCFINISLCLKRIASKKPQSSAGYETMFLKRRENVWSCVGCASPVTSVPRHSRARRDQAIGRRQYMENADGEDPSEASEYLLESTRYLNVSH